MEKKHKSKPNYLLGFSQIALNEVQIDNLDTLSIASINISNLAGQLIIDKQGRLKYIDDLRKSFNRESTNDTAIANTTINVNEQVEKPANKNSQFTIKTGTIQTTGKNSFTLKDASKTPYFQMNFRDIAFKLSSLVSQDKLPT